MHNGGFPINGPGEIEGIHKQKSHHANGKKKKKKKKDYRPNTSQQPGFKNEDDEYEYSDVAGDYSENGQSHYSASLSARERKRQQMPAPNLGERNKSVGSTNTNQRNPNNFPMGQIAQPSRSRDGSATRLSDPGDFTADQTRHQGRVSDNSANLHTYTNATVGDGFFNNNDSFLKMGNADQRELSRKDGYGASRQSNMRSRQGGNEYDYETPQYETPQERILRQQRLEKDKMDREMADLKVKKPFTRDDFR